MKFHPQPAATRHPASRFDRPRQSPGKMPTKFMVKTFGLFVAAMTLVVSGVVAAGGNFAGVAVTPGATVRASVPLSPQERQYVSEGGNAMQKVGPILTVLMFRTGQKTVGSE